MAISDWPEAQRPRERLLHHGAARLSDAELLAVLLRVGVAGKSAVALAQDMVNRFGSLTGLFAASEADISTMRGLGPAKFALLQAVLELARRVLGEQLQGGALLKDPAAVRNYLRLQLGAREEENFLVLFLDAQSRLIASEELFRGTLHRTTVHPREVVKAALAHNAAAVIFAHNHPSGSAEPSVLDGMLTKTLRTALDLVEIALVDHFIIARDQVYSFAEHRWAGV